jgi:hypothetical protein
VWTEAPSHIDNPIIGPGKVFIAGRSRNITRITHPREMVFENEPARNTIALRSAPMTL